MRELKHSHDVPRDSCSSCLKDRTSKRKANYSRDGKELQAKARAQGFSISLATPYGEIIPMFSFSHQRERKKLPS